MEGRTVLFQAGELQSNEQIIDVHTLAPGLYLVEATKENGTVRQKLLIQ